MSGAVYQINVKGKQDEFLTGNPEHNFVRQVYKRYINFASTRYEIQVNNNIDFNTKIDAIIPRNGDYLYKCYLSLTLPKLEKTSGTYASWTNSIGHSIIDYAEFSIDGYVIDRQYGLYLELINELTSVETLTSSDNDMIGKVSNLDLLKTSALTENQYFIPLKFWFCKNIGSALPLVNLAYKTLRISVKFRNFDDCIIYDGSSPPNKRNIVDAKIISEYIIVEEMERERIVNNDMSYLIHQVQYVSAESIPPSGFHISDLTFNHPCSELIFVLRETDSEENNDWFNFSKRNTTVMTKVEPLLKDLKVLADGTEIISLTKEKQYRLINLNRYHTNNTDKHIYCITFANEPEKWFPTGTLNFSLINTAELHVNTESDINSPVNIHVFAVCYNTVNITQSGTFRLNYAA